MGHTSAASQERLQRRLESYMEQEGLRHTTQRKLVSDVFFAAGGHLTIDDVLSLVREQDQRVGYATVYRTMRLLVESGVAAERHFGDSTTRFEIKETDHHHDHLICAECKRIVEFENDAIEELQEKVAARHGFQLVSHKLELYGVCPDCQKKAAR